MTSDAFKRDSQPGRPAALHDGTDDSVFDRTTAVPSIPAGSDDEPPTKPQSKISGDWAAAAANSSKPTSSQPPPTARAQTAPRLLLDPEVTGSTPLGLAELHAQGRTLTAPPPMVGHAESEPPPPSLEESNSQMQACYEVGDFSGALAAAERVLELRPDDAEASRYAQSCRDVLTQMFTARLAPLNRRVSVAVSPEQIRWLSLDHKSGFLLSLIDGNSTIEELLDISGMARLEALRILLTLSQQKVIALS